MSDNFHETKKYRCLIEYPPHVSEDVHLRICGIERCTPNKSFGPVIREGYHLHLVLSGEGTLVVNGKSNRVHEGQFFLEKPNEKTYYYPNPSNPWAYCWIAFEGLRAAELAQSMGFTDGVNIRNCHIEGHRFYRLISSMLDNPEISLSHQLHRQGLMFQCIGLAVESYQKSLNGKCVGTSSPRTYVDRAKDFVRNNFSSISVADISNHLGINRHYFARLFKEMVGISPGDYLRNVRMYESAQLLINTAMSIQDIATYVGYDSALSFSRAFKNAIGISPKFYRDMPEFERECLGIPIGNLERK